jgi:hypothetical protein
MSATIMDLISPPTIGDLLRLKLGAVLCGFDDGYYRNGGQSMNKITPFLWFNDNAEEVCHQRCSFFVYNQVIHGAVPSRNIAVEADSESQDDFSWHAAIVNGRSLTVNAVRPYDLCLDNGDRSCVVGKDRTILRRQGRSIPRCTASVSNGR